MLVQFLFAFGLTIATVIIHALGTLEAIAHLARVRRKRQREYKFLTSELQIVRIVSVLLLLHLIETSVWAAFYAIAGVLPEMETAVLCASATAPLPARSARVTLPLRRLRT